MGGANTRLDEHMAAAREDPAHFPTMRSYELFALDPEAVREIQFAHLERHFERLRPRVKVLDRLAKEVGIDRARSLDDLVPLGLPHTMYKSYAVSDIENGRWDRLTKWLGTLSAYDLAKADLSGVETVEGWIDRLEAVAPIRPVSSSGTTGKISILPRGIPEEEGQLNSFMRFLDPWPGQPGLDLRDGTVPFICPWPSDGGRQTFGRLLVMLRSKTYKDRPQLLHTLAKGWISADELQLASRLRKAELAGEEIDLSEIERRTAEIVAERNRSLPNRLDSFVDNVLTQYEGQKVVLFGFWTQLYQLAVACKDKGIKVKWSPDSLIMTGGGTKGFTFPDGWREVLDEVFPFYIRQNYAMSESSAASIGCTEDHLHPLPWGIIHVLDPVTSQPLPRSGVQTGRVMVHDLISNSLWPTTLTGDLATMNFDGNCPCGRRGPYLLNSIGRLSEAMGGDDKITCARTPQAYERLEEFALSSGL